MLAFKFHAKKQEAYVKYKKLNFVPFLIIVGLLNSDLISYRGKSCYDIVLFFIFGKLSHREDSLANNSSVVSYISKTYKLIF